MRRKVIPEMLDTDQGTPAEVAASFVDLRHINNWFGGTRTTITLLRQVAEQSSLEPGAQANAPSLTQSATQIAPPPAMRKLSLLEVAAGSGDIPLLAQRALAGQGIDLRITLLDRMGTHLPGAVINSVVGDALHLPFGDNAFDVVSSSLFAHHLEPDELRQYAQESLRVCRRAVLINDLIRSPLHLALVHAGLPLFRSRITWHDAPASVRRAYTRQEMTAMLVGLPARGISVSRHYLYRMGVLLWK